MLCSMCGKNPREVKAKCRPCYNDYMREYMNKRYHRRRALALAQLGGRCVDCGTQSDLEFDHAVAASKSFDIAKFLNGVAEAKLQAELKKIVLRCHRCHVDKSRRSDWGAVDHGGGVSGKKNCRCEKCAPLKNKYVRDLKRKRKASDRIAH